MNPSPAKPKILTGCHAIIVGGGITGLAAALVLGERGARITLLERDPEPQGKSPGEAFLAWQRRGVPQVRHSHVFLGRMRTLLREHYPQLLDALVAAGAREMRPLDRPPPALADMRSEPGDEDLVALGCRRITFEWVMRQIVLHRAQVTVVPEATVTGLIATATDPPVVAGVRYRTPTGEREVRGHFVVDASGRRSAAPAWLAAIGARPPYDKQEQSGVVYYTRFYRLGPGAVEPPQTKDPVVGDFNWVKFAVFPADDRTFSITLAVPLEFQRLKVLSQAPAFDAMVQSIPGLVPWIEVSKPIGDPQHPVQAMGGLINRLRRFADDHGPLALRFFVLGDAAYCTNPLYGRGCSQGLLHAHFLGEAIDAHHGDWTAIAMALDARGRAELEPFYRASVLADRDSVRRAKGREPRRMADRMQQRFFHDGIAIAMRTDPVVFRAFLRMLNMFETPEQAFGHPEVVARTLWVMAQGEEFKRRHAMPDPPDRDATIARCEAALAGAA